jgi:hypothetical protein
MATVWDGAKFTLEEEGRINAAAAGGGALGLSASGEQPAPPPAAPAADPNGGSWLGNLLDNVVPDDSGGIPIVGPIFQGLGHTVDATIAVSNFANHVYSAGQLLADPNYLRTQQSSTPFEQAIAAWNDGNYVSPGQAYQDAHDALQVSGHWQIALNDPNDPAFVGHKFTEEDLKDTSHFHRQWKSDTWVSSVTSGVADAAVDWFLDPTVLAGKGVKAVRVAKYVGDITSAPGREARLAQYVTDIRDHHQFLTSGGTAGRETAAGQQIAEAIGKDFTDTGKDMVFGRSTDPGFLPTLLKDAPDLDTAFLTVEAALPGAVGRDALRALQDSHASIADDVATYRGFLDPAKDVTRGAKPGDTVNWAQAHIDNPLAAAFHKPIFDDLLKRDVYLSKALQGADESVDAPARIANTITAVGSRNMRVNQWQRATGTMRSDIKWGSREARASGMPTDIEGGPIWSMAMKTYQATMYSRPVHVLSWLAGEKPQNIIRFSGANGVDSHKEVSAMLNTISVWDKSPEIKKAHINKWMAAQTDTEREHLLINLQKDALNAIAAKHGLDPKEAAQIIDDYQKAHSVMRQQLAQNGYMVEADGSFATVPQMRSQEAQNFAVMMPFDLVDKVMGRSVRAHESGLRAASLRGSEHVADFGTVAAMKVNNLFRPLVLLRPAFVPRNVAEANMAAAAAAGTLPTFAHALEGIPNWMVNRKMGLTDRFLSLQGKSPQQLVNRLETQRKFSMSGRRATEAQMRTHLGDLDTIYASHQKVLQGRLMGLEGAVGRHQSQYEANALADIRLSPYGEAPARPLTQAHQAYIDQRDVVRRQIAVVQKERGAIRDASRKKGNPADYLAFRDRQLATQIEENPVKMEGIGPKALAKRQASAEEKFADLSARTGLPAFSPLIAHHDAILQNLEDSGVHLRNFNRDIERAGTNIASIGTEQAGRRLRRLPLSKLSTRAQNEIAQTNASASVTVHNALSGALTNEERRLRATKNMTTVKPDDRHYFDALTYTLERQFRYDPVGQMIIKGASVRDVNRFFTKPAGKEYLRSVGVAADGGPAHAQKLWDDLYRYTDGNVNVIHALDESADPIHANQLKGWLGGSKNLSPIHGPDYEANALSGGARFKEWAYETIGSNPETRLARHPFYATMHERFVSAQLAHYAATAEQPTAATLKAIDVAAHRYALTQLKDTLYTIDRYSNSASKLSNIMPFYAAWENTLKRWTKFAVRDPSVVAHGFQIYNSPLSLGIVYDQNGNKITNKTFNPMENRYLHITLGEWTHLPKEMRDVVVNQNNMNVIAQGETPYLPGGGPLLTIPASEFVKAHPDSQSKVAAMIGPEAADQLFKTVLPFGPSSAPFSADQMVASYMRRGFQMAMGTADPREGQQIATVWKSMHQDWLLAGGHDSGQPEPTMEMAQQSSHNISLLELLTSWAAPTSAQFQTPYTFYADQWKNLLTQMPRDKAVIEFHKQYGTQYDQWMLGSTKNTSGVDPTITAYQAVQGSPDLAEFAGKADPALLGMLFNNGEYKFDKAVYTWQQTHGIFAGSATEFRTAKDPAEIEKAVHQGEGWAKYTAMKEGLNAIAISRGKKSYTDDADLSAGMKAFRVALAGENADWGNSYDSYAGGGWHKTIRVLQEAIGDAGFMKAKADDPKWQLITTYMATREAAVAAKKNAPDSTTRGAITTAWSEYGAALSSQNPDFASFYSRWLDSDTLDEVG